jgi:hypothetical protein
MRGAYGAAEVVVQLCVGRGPDRGRSSAARVTQAMCNARLVTLSPRCDAPIARTGRLSTPPQQSVRAMLLHTTLFI